MCETAMNLISGGCSRYLKPVCTAPTSAAALARFDYFAGTWCGRYPASIALWRTAWSEFVPFLDHDVEVSLRRLVSRQADRCSL
jgi:transposase-like protein